MASWSSSMALASLTETYTDSEGEDDTHANDEQSTGEAILTTPNTSPHKANSNPQSQHTTPIVAPIKRAKLVSYLDDTVLSDDENADESSVSHVKNVETTPEEIAEGGVQLPAEPSGKCSDELQNKIARLHEKMQDNALDMNAVIQQRKDFRNPSIYEKLIIYCSINELGTNYPPIIYDPTKWNKESYYEELAKVQKIEMDKREKERKNKVEFVVGTKKVEDDAKKRKSKWDQPGGSGIAPTNIKPAGLAQSSVISTIPAKTALISAFGSLSKKPKFV